MECFKVFELVTITVPKDIIKMIIAEKRAMARAVDENIKNMNQLFEKAEQVGASRSEVALFAAINGIGSHIVVEVLEHALKEADKKQRAADVKN